MRWFFDTEFDDNGRTIDLISIALVSEAGEEYSACLHDGWYPELCDAWIVANVLPKLPLDEERKTRIQVAREIRLVVGEKPEFWGYYADYDWVALCQLYGKMIDIPSGWPLFCRDLKQLIVDREVSKETLPRQMQGSKHDALADARWVRDAWLFIRSTGIRGG